MSLSQKNKADILGNMDLEKYDGDDALSSEEVVYTSADIETDESDEIFVERRFQRLYHD